MPAAGFGRLLDFGVIVPRLEQLYEWSARELGAPALPNCLRDGALTYAWPFDAREVWQPKTSVLLDLVRRGPPARDVSAGRRL